MNKEAFYFPHFSNARNDRKVKRLRMQLGIEGYGIYFMLLETLREQTDLRYPLSDIDLLANDFGTSEQKVKVVVMSYELFEIDENEQFFSPKLFEYLQPYFKMKEQRKIAGLKSAEKRSKPLIEATPVQQPFNTRSTKEKKVKEIKVKENKEEAPLSKRDEIWKTWFDYKKQRKQSYTEMGKKALLNRYEDESDETLTLMIEQSIVNNWSGLFPLKEELKRKQTTLAFPNNDKPYEISIPEDF